MIAMRLSTTHAIEDSIASHTARRLCGCLRREAGRSGRKIRVNQPLDFTPQLILRLYINDQTG